MGIQGSAAKMQRANYKNLIQILYLVNTKHGLCVGDGTLLAALKHSVSTLQKFNLSFQPYYRCYIKLVTSRYGKKFS
jgi:hypothetical protein